MEETMKQNMSNGSRGMAFCAIINVEIKSNVKNVINDNSLILNEFSKSLDPERVLTTNEFDKYKIKR